MNTRQKDAVLQLRAAAQNAWATLAARADTESAPLRDELHRCIVAVEAEFKTWRPGYGELGAILDDDAADDDESTMSVFRQVGDRLAVLNAIDASRVLRAHAILRGIGLDE
jgi:hypothetical protein